MTSVQLYSVRGAWAENPLGTLERLREIGFDEVEPFALLEHGDALEMALERAGLRAPSTHASLRPDSVDRTLELAQRLGIATVIEPAIHEGWDTDAGVGRIAEQLNAAADRAAATGITIGYHNHWWEFGELGGRTALEVLADRLRPEVVLELDLYWAAVAGIPVADVARRLGDRITHVHVKDGPLDRDPASQVPVGEGSAPVVGVLAACPQAMRVIEFDDYAGDLFTGLAVSLRNLATLEEVR